MNDLVAKITPQMALVAITANNSLLNHPKDLAEKSIELAEALVEKMQEKEIEATNEETTNEETTSEETTNEETTNEETTSEETTSEETTSEETTK